MVSPVYHLVEYTFKMGRNLLLPNKVSIALLAGVLTGFFYFSHLTCLENARLLKEVASHFNQPVDEALSAVPGTLPIQLMWRINSRGKSPSCRPAPLPTFKTDER